MRKVGALIVLLLFLGATNKSYSQKFGVKGGLNLSKFSGSDDNNATFHGDYTMKTGFQIGGTVRWEFSDFFSVDMGVRLSSKGASLNNPTGGSVSILYINVPVRPRFDFKVGKLGIFASFGPYVGQGLTGKIKTGTTSESITFGSYASEGADYKRADIGTSVAAGVVLRSFEIAVNLENSLVNISSITGNGTKLKNSCTSMTIAYVFGE